MGAIVIPDEPTVREQMTELFEGKSLEEARELMFQYQRMMTYYQCAIMEVETKFRVLNEEFSLQYDRNPINGIHSRLKSNRSMVEKIHRKGLPFTISSIEENITDIAGIRVICSFVGDVYLLEEALLKQDDIELVRRKDYIANPKPNGYRSLHLIVTVPIFLSQEKRLMKVEVQLRTIAMDSWAAIEHQLRYKKDYEISQDELDELRMCADISHDLDQRMDLLRQTILVGQKKSKKKR